MGGLYCIIQSVLQYDIEIMEGWSIQNERWEFDMENSNMKGHWVGIFTPKKGKTEIEFTENVTVKKSF